ncbi:MAG: hypothetical protein LUC40_00150, partial [Oscillospiraceae bacterium]|nr:hypothetical protein [Oscillospiraceae bacterium]
RRFQPDVPARLAGYILQNDSFQKNSYRFRLADRAAERDDRSEPLFRVPLYNQFMENTSALCGLPERQHLFYFARF